MQNTFFITGTDTDIGKTFITIGLINYFKKKGKSAIGMKPISAGLENFNGNMINADVAYLMAVNSINIPQQTLNCYSFKDAASPHIASNNENISIDFNVIKNQVENLSLRADYLFVEGAGGYDCPLDQSRNISDLIKHIDIPVIVIVGIKLGCLNHAILTMKALEQKEQRVFGWIANMVDPNMAFQKENIAHLKGKIKSSFLGCIPNLSYNKDMDISDHISWPPDL